jgi:hypothetical protein
MTDSGPKLDGFEGDNGEIVQLQMRNKATLLCLYKLHGNDKRLRACTGNWSTTNS